MNTDQPHRWRFFRVGGFDQVRLESAEDIARLPELDQKLWAALSCPVRGLEFDARTLAMLDTDGDERVRAPEILAAVKWISSVLKDLTPVMNGQNHLPLAAIDTERSEGRQLLESARQILSYLDKTDSPFITIEDVADIAALIKQSTLNGDGIIIPASAKDAAIKQLIEDIMATLGSVEDRSGQQGIALEHVQAFFDACAAYAAWWTAAQDTPEIFPLNDSTPAAVDIVDGLRDRIQDYFTRCRVAAFDPKAREALNPSMTAYEGLCAEGLTGIDELRRFPLARIEPNRPLPLAAEINPAWAAEMDAFRTEVVVPLLGEQNELSSAQWAEIRTILAPYAQWQLSKPGAEVEPLGQERIRTILEDNNQPELEALIGEDARLAAQIDGFDAVAKAVHLTRDLLHLLNNFIAFRDFYAQDRAAIFQAGTLYLDGRACELCVRVDNADTHAPLATLSQTYLAYCRCRRRGHDDQMFIAAAVTSGEADNLRVGRNGVFYDQKGNDWDATITKIIEHPISVRQAFWSPYKRLARMVGDQIEKFAATKDKAVDAGAGAQLSQIGAKPGTAKTPTPFDIGKFAGIFAAIGLAVGAIGTALASILGGLLSLSWWQIPLVLGAVLLLISGPAMLIAYLKLRQRNLAPILDACGWAVNTKARINLPFGATLTKLAELPQGAERTLRDPFAEKKTPWRRWLALLILLIALGMAWEHGWFQKLGTMLRTTNATVVENATGGSALPPAPNNATQK